MNAVPAIIPDDQHDRARFIGGSDVAAVLGISPWRTPLQLWERKTATALSGPETAKKVYTRGHRWESVVAEMLVELLEADGHTVEIVGTNRRYIDPERPFLAAEIDMEIRLDGEDDITNVELKTVHPFKANEWGESEDDVPVWYMAQAMHGLGVTGRKRAILAPLFGADEIRAYPIERDDETLAAMRARCDAFWMLVTTGIRPDPLTLADLDRLYKGDDSAPALIADDDLTRNALRLRAIKAEIKARELEAEAIEFDVKRAMGTATELVIPNDSKKVAVVWKDRDYTWLDQAALKEQEPKLHRSLQRKTTTRVFTVK